MNDIDLVQEQKAMMNPSNKHRTVTQVQEYKEKEVKQSRQPRQIPTFANTPTMPMCMMCKKQSAKIGNKYCDECNAQRRAGRPTTQVVLVCQKCKSQYDKSFGACPRCNKHLL